MSKIVLEFIKVKGLPHPESEPHPPSASLELLATHTINDVESGNIVPSVFHSREIPHTTNPFFNDKVELELVPETIQKPNGVHFPRVGSQQLDYISKQNTSSDSQKGLFANIKRSSQLNTPRTTPYLTCNITIWDNNKTTAAPNAPPKPIYYTCFRIPTGAAIPGPQCKTGGVSASYYLHDIADHEGHVTRASDRFLPPDTTFIAQCIAVVSDVSGSASPDIGEDAQRPVLYIRYRVTPIIQPEEEVDPHCDVMLEREPKFTAKYSFIPEDCQYVWYNLLVDRNWQLQFSHAVMKEWPTLPKILPKTGAESPSRARLLSTRRSTITSPARSPVTRSVGMRPGAPVVYKSLAELMAKHWSVKRSHELLTRLRLAAEKFHKSKGSVAFTSDEEVSHKLLWRERQVVCLANVIKRLEGLTSTDKIRILLDKLWVNMVYGIPADNPNAPPISFEMRYKMASMQFTVKHATILQACLLQQLVPFHGLTYDAAMAIAAEDFDPSHISYASHYSSLQGGEYTLTEGLVMGFGRPVTASLPPPLPPQLPLETIAQTLRANAVSIHTIMGEPVRERRQGRDNNNNILYTQQSDTTNTNVAPSPMQYTPQILFTTVMINFIGRLIDTYTEHELEIILLTFVPAVTAASKKCMLSGHVPISRRKRSKSRANNNNNNNNRTKTKDGVIKIEYLDALGRVVKGKRHHTSDSQEGADNNNNNNNNNNENNNNNNNENNEEDLFGMLDDAEGEILKVNVCNDFSGLLDKVASGHT